MRRGIIAVLIFGVIAVSSEASVLYDFMDRSVSASNNQGGFDHKSSSGPGLFDETASVSWEGYAATATQTSVIGPGGIVAEGAAEGEGPFYYWHPQHLQQSSRSYLNVIFELTAPLEVVLTGDLHLSVDVGGTNYDLPEVKVELSGPNGTLFYLDIDDYNQFGSGDYHKPFHEIFLLDPGLYTLTADALTNGWYTRYDDEIPGVGGGGFASYDFILDLPEPATLWLMALGLLLTRRRRPCHSLV